MTTSNPHVIGITGTLGSGKGTVSDFLHQKGYKIYVFSDVIKKELRKEGREITRENMQDKGNELREEFGANIIAKKIAENIISDSAELAIADGARNPEEIIYLKNHFKNYFTIGVTASADTRFKLIKSRNKSFDRMDREVFDKLERRGRGEGETKSGQQEERCLELADYIIENEGTVEELEAKVRKVLARLDN
jgi:dephospho-CoA kinase